MMCPGTQDSSSLPNQGASLLEIDNPGVTLLTWKRAEDGDGTILRLQDTAGEASNIRIHSPFLTFERAWLCNLLEDNQAEIKIQGDDLSVPIKPFQVLTLRLHTTPRIRQGGAPMNLDFTGKVAIVTGGAMGIGEATARKLAGLGASVAILDVDRDAGRKVPPRSRRTEHICDFFPLQCKCRHRGVASRRRCS